MSRRLRSGSQTSEEYRKDRLLLDGFINLLKPAGMTSHDAVSALRRILRTKKTGHTGTLDPMAAGVLPVCAGRATRAAEYLEADRKRYRCELLLGAASDTGDIGGEVSYDGSGAAGRLTHEQVREAILSVEGEQLQYPPMYSAIKKDGKKLYEYAREGIAVEVEPRAITVYEALPLRIFHEPGRALFEIECSKGTYIRSICEQIGKKLGCGAVMTFLVRTRSGGFDIGQSVTLEEIIAEIQEKEHLTYEEVVNPGKKPSQLSFVPDFLMPVGDMLTDFGKILLNGDEMKKYVNGGKLSLRNVEIRRENSRSSGDRFRRIYRVYGEDGSFAGTAQFDEKRKIFTVGKVFFR